MPAKLKVADVLSFKAEAQKIKPNELLPILSFLKVELNGDSCTLTKNGLKSFVKKTIPSEGGKKVLLIKEDILFNLCDHTDFEFVEIAYANNKIVLTSGNTEVKSPSDDPSKFPLNDIPTTSWIEVSVEVISGLANAINFIADDEKKTDPAKHIFIKDKLLVACTGAIGFAKPLNQEAPEMILRKEVASAISSLENVEYANNSSYDFFKSKDLFYAFSKPECNFFDLSQLAKLESQELSFFAMKDDLIKFNSLCLSSNKSKLVNATFKAISKEQLELNMVDSDFGVDIKRVLEIKEGSGEFKFNPDLMNTLLRSIPTTQAYFYPGKNKYFITDEAWTFFALIMGVI